MNYTTSHRQSHVRLAAHFAMRFVNKSHRTCDVDPKRFATSHRLARAIDVRE